MRESPRSSNITTASRPSSRRNKVLAALASLTVVGLVLLAGAWRRRAPGPPSAPTPSPHPAPPGALPSRTLSVQRKGVSGLHGRVTDPGSVGIRAAKVCAYPMPMEHVARSTPDL